MSARWVAALGGVASFVAASVAGVVGNQLSKDISWAWLVFGIALILGASVTGWTAYRTSKLVGTARRGGPRSGGLTHTGDARIGRVSAGGGQAVGVNYGSMVQTHNRDSDVAQ